MSGAAPRFAVSGDGGPRGGSSADQRSRYVAPHVPLTSPAIRDRTRRSTNSTTRAEVSPSARDSRILARHIAGRGQEPETGRLRKLGRLTIFPRKSQTRGDLQPLYGALQSHGGVPTRREVQPSNCRLPYKGAGDDGLPAMASARGIPRAAPCV